MIILNVLMNVLMVVCLLLISGAYSIIYRHIEGYREFWGSEIQEIITPLSEEQLKGNN